MGGKEWRGRLKEARKGAWKDGAVEQARDERLHCTAKCFGEEESPASNINKAVYGKERRDEWRKLE